MTLITQAVVNLYKQTLGNNKQSQFEYTGGGGGKLLANQPLFVLTVAQRVRVRTAGPHVIQQAVKLQ
jgi:hypothetical protein